MRKGDVRFAPGTVFEGYQLVSLLGEGGMGSVWKAIHLKLKKFVAIKTLKGDHARSEQARLRFLREGEAASRIRHPHVVEVYDFGAVGGTCYLVMEFLEGESLAARFHRDRVLAPAALADLMVPVCAAVAAAHEARVVHRDLKPDNIFLMRTRDGSMHPKVLDFGISRVQDEEAAKAHTATTALLGTPRYMAPEQARGNNREVNERCDQYALGVILYQGATGALPIDEQALYRQLDRVVRGHFVPPRAVRPELPAGFEEIILKAMANRAEDRFASARDLGAALLEYASERTRVVFGASFLDTAHTLPEPEPLTAAVSPSPTLEGSALEVTTVERPPRVPRSRNAALLGGIAVAALIVCIGTANLVIRRSTARTTATSPPARPSPVATIAAPLTPAPLALAPTTPRAVAPVATEPPPPPRSAAAPTAAPPTRGASGRRRAEVVRPRQPGAEATPRVEPAAPRPTPPPAGELPSVSTTYVR